MTQAAAELQAAQDAAAKLVFNRAYKARRAQLVAAMEAAAQHPEVRAAHQAVQASGLALAAARSVPTAEEAKELQSQISALTEQLRLLTLQLARLHSKDGERLPEEDAWRKAQATHAMLAEKALAAALTQFPDMEGQARWSAAHWAAPAEVLAEMERARCKVALDHKPDPEPKSNKARAAQS